MKVKGIENKVTLEFVAVFHRVTNLIVSANASGKAVPLSMLQVVVLHSFFLLDYAIEFYRLIPSTWWAIQHYPFLTEFTAIL